MKRIQNISLIDVLKEFGGRKDTDFVEEREGEYRTLCFSPEHDDANPSMMIYDNTDKGDGWAYHCYGGKCNIHGNQLDALIEMGIVDSHEDAIDVLRKEFNLVLPRKLTLETFCDFKGLDLQVCKDIGASTVEDGVAFPIKTLDGEIVRRKIRVKFRGKNKYRFTKEVEDAPVLPFLYDKIQDYSADEVYIVEGETDALTLYTHDYPVIGATNNRWKDWESLQQLERFNRILIVNDDDEAGEKLLYDISKKYPEKTFQKKLDKFNDVNDMYNIGYLGNSEKFLEKFERLKEIPLTTEAFLKTLETDISILNDRETFLYVYNQLKTPIAQDKFINDIKEITDIGKTVIKDTIADFTKQELMADKVKFNDELYISNGCYCKTLLKGDKMIEEQITNFIIKPSYVIVNEDDEDWTRVGDVVGADGTVAHNVEFTPEDFTTSQNFHRKLISIGNFLFTGQLMDMKEILHKIYEAQPKKVIQPSFIGRLDDGKWLLPDFGVDSDGRIQQCNDEGIITMDGTFYTTSTAGGADNVNPSVPEFDLSTDVDNLVDLKKEFTHTFKRSFGTFGAWLGLGWVVASYYSNSIYDHYKCFPYLFVSGKRSSGKTTFCTFLNQFFGYGANSSMSIEGATKVGILRFLGYKSSLPQHYDDFKNDAVRNKNNLLLDVYNRHGTVKGTRHSHTDVNSNVIRGNLLLSGESVPNDSAVLTRCVTLPMSKHDGDRSRRVFSRLTHLGEQVEHIGLDIIKDTQSQQNVDELLETINDLEQEIDDHINDARYALNHAILGGAFKYYFKDVVDEKEMEVFIDWIIEKSSEDYADNKDDHVVGQFFGALNSLCLEYWKDMQRSIHITHDRVYVSYSDVYNLWSRYNKTFGLPTEVNRTTMRGYLKEEQALINASRSAPLHNGERRRCMVFDLNTLRKEYPEAISDLEHVIKEIDEDDTEEAEY